MNVGDFKRRLMKIEGVSIFYIRELTKKSISVLKRDGTSAFLACLFRYVVYGRDYFKLNGRNSENDYVLWIKANEIIDSRRIRGKIENLKYRPKISIITPVYNVDPKWLDRCIRSVKDQLYENWELCLHDDASSRVETLSCLRKWEKSDRRIKVSYGKKNRHISAASNEALKLATGEFVALLDNDDELSSDALYENVKALNKYPETDLLYSDEDKIDIHGSRIDPFFKPDWSPDLVLSMNYICHLSVYRTEIVKKICGFRSGFEGAQDYDLLLRFLDEISEKNIIHIPKVLYHWRKISGSTAERFDFKGYANDAAKRSLREYLQRNAVSGSVEDGEFPGTYRVKRIVFDSPKVSIIIPFRDQSGILKKCVESLFKKTKYENFEVLLVDNQSEELSTHAYLESLSENKRIRIVKYDRPFNFSAINNFAVKYANGKFVLFLNNDIEVISEDWLGSMVEHIEREKVGAVGAKLLYPNNTIQHAGVIMGTGIAGHAFKYFPADAPGYFSMLSVIRNYCAVTGACLLTKKSLFEEIGGFDEINLAIAYNDVDFCLRLLKSGYLVVYTPYAKLYHHESLSRGNDEALKYINPAKYQRVLAEREYMGNTWGAFIRNDPYYNKNLTRKSENFGIRYE